VVNLGWITDHNNNRINLGGDWVIKVNGREIDRRGSLEEAKRVADEQHGEVWYNNQLMYTAVAQEEQITEQEEPEQQEPEHQDQNRPQPPKNKPRNLGEKVFGDYW
jgi:hypothetical protein